MFLRVHRGVKDCPQIGPKSISFWRAVKHARISAVPHVACTEYCDGTRGLTLSCGALTREHHENGEDIMHKIAMIAGLLLGASALAASAQQYDRNNQASGTSQTYGQTYSEPNSQSDQDRFSQNGQFQQRDQDADSAQNDQDDQAAKPDQDDRMAQNQSRDADMDRDLPPGQMKDRDKDRDQADRDNDDHPGNAYGLERHEKSADADKDQDHAASEAEATTTDTDRDRDSDNTDAARNTAQDLDRDEAGRYQGNGQVQDQDEADRPGADQDKDQPAP